MADVDAHQGVQPHAARPLHLLLLLLLLALLLLSVLAVAAGLPGLQVGDGAAVDLHHLEDLGQGVHGVAEAQHQGDAEALLLLLLLAVLLLLLLLGSLGDRLQDEDVVVAQLVVA